MNWLRTWIRSLMGHDERYHRQASQTTARKLDAELRRRRVERLSEELDLYRRRHPNVH